MNRDRGKMVLAILAIGLVAGLGAAGFLTALEGAAALFLGRMANYVPITAGSEPPLFHVTPSGDLLRWMLLVLPTAGGLVSGLITFTFAPEVEGHGTDAAIEAFHFKDGAVRRRVPFFKALTSAITIGTGGSGGREGPIAQIGSGFASMLSDWLRMPSQTRRILMAAGMAAGIGAIFHAPLAGAIFAAEVMYRGPHIEADVLLPAFTASIIAYCVFGSIFGFEALFVTPAYHFEQPLMLIPYALLALVAAGGAMLYTRFFYGVRRVMFGSLHIPNHLKPALGGLATGIIGFFLPEALGTGYGVLQSCFDADAGRSAGVAALPSFDAVSGLFLGSTTSPALAAAVVLLVIALGKIATTGFSIGSGGSGGVFGPAVVIGGALGAATGYVSQILFPALPVHPGAFAVVGMAGFFAAAANTPISTIIMVSEMTGNYDLLLPAMFVCAVAYVLCKRFTLYEKQLASPFEAPAHVGAAGRSFLTQFTVLDALSVCDRPATKTVGRDAPLDQIAAVFAETSQSHLVVVDDEGYPLGTISRELADMLEATENAPIIAGDLASPTPFVAGDDTALRVANLLTDRGLGALPAVDKDDFSRVLGVVGNKELVDVYSKLAGRDSMLP